MTNENDLQKSEKPIKKAVAKKEAVVKKDASSTKKPVAKKEPAKKKSVKKEETEVVAKKKFPKVKKPKDGPKKNLTSYMWFCNSERKNIKKENQSLSSKAVISELASRWQEVKKDSDKLKTYEKMAQDDKERYLREKESHSASKVGDVIVEESEEVPIEVPIEAAAPAVVEAATPVEVEKKVKKPSKKK